MKQSCTSLLLSAATLVAVLGGGPLGVSRAQTEQGHVSSSRWLSLTAPPGCLAEDDLMLRIESELRAVGLEVHGPALEIVIEETQSHHFRASLRWADAPRNVARLIEPEAPGCVEVEPLLVTVAALLLGWADNEPDEAGPGTPDSNGAVVGQAEQSLVPDEDEVVPVRIVTTTVGMRIDVGAVGTLGVTNTPAAGLAIGAGLALRNPDVLVELRGWGLANEPTLLSTIDTESRSLLETMGASLGSCVPLNINVDGSLMLRLSGCAALELVRHRLEGEQQVSPLDAAPIYSSQVLEAFTFCLSAGFEISFWVSDWLPVALRVTATVPTQASDLYLVDVPLVPRAGFEPVWGRLELMVGGELF